MTSRSPALVILLGFLGWSSASCSTTASVSVAQQTVSPAAVASPSSPLSTAPKQICLGPLPATWSAALAQGTVPISGITRFGVQAVDPTSGLAYGAYDSTDPRDPSNTSQIAAVDLKTGAVTEIAKVPPSAGGVGWMSAADPWLAWVELDSQTNLGVWRLFAWNRTTHETIQVANSQLSDGTYLQGRETYPVVGRGYVAWAEPVGQSAVEVRVFRFDTRSTLVLDRGMVSSPLLVGPYLAWGKLSSLGGSISLGVVDAVTLDKMPTPAGLATPRVFLYAAGSPDYLVWTPDGHSWLAQAVRDGSVASFHLPADGTHIAQFPFAAGSDVIWWSGGLTTLVDLRTGKGFDFPGGSAAGAGDMVVVTGLKGESETVSSIRVSELETLNNC